MPIIDAYCGMGPWASRDALLPHTPEEILAIMDGCGIERALIFGRAAVDCGWPPDANALVAEIARAQPRFLPAFVLFPHAHACEHTVEGYFAEMRDAGARAAWVWPVAGTPPLWVYEEIYARCQAERMPLFLSAARYTPAALDELCGAFPALRVVLTDVHYTSDHWLYPLFRRRPELRLCYGPAYVSALGLERFVDAFGAGRLLFGSGLPECAPGGLLGMAHYAGLSDADQAAILGGNLLALLEGER